MSDRPAKILFLVTEDRAFLSHRLPMARAAIATGADVYVATRMTRHADTIGKAGVHVIHINMDRGNKNPLRELITVASLVAILWRIRPDILHNSGVKPSIDGSLAALFAPAGHVVNMFTGMGAVFVETDKKSVLRRTITLVLRLLMSRKNTTAVVQNRDDARLLADLGISSTDRCTLIPGSGVNLTDYPALPEPSGPVTFTLAARLLWDKGISEFVEAAKLVAADYPDVRFVVVGEPDPANPKSVDTKTLDRWRDLGIVRFTGQRSDIADIWARSHVAVLPSYREGMPKSMLEAASSGRPLIVTDVPGCRDLVRDGQNGLLVPVQDSKALATAMIRLAADQSLRRLMGHNARKDAEEKFSDQVIEQATRELYQRIFRQAARCPR